MHSNIHGFLGLDSAYADARSVVFGVPFDGTTSFRPGTRFGPDAMRHESDGLETWSPYFGRDLTDCAAFDAGNINIPFGNTQAVLGKIYRATKRILTDGKRPVMLGGEHLATLGAVQAVAEMYPDLCVIHFDAHADLREEYLGETLSHATVMRRVWDLLGDGRIYQFGIRSMSREEADFAAERHVAQRKFDCKNFAETLECLKGVPLYISLDLDVLDPSAFPGTGTPEAGGITFKELMTCILALGGHNIRGIDVMELSPHYDHSGVSTATACKAVRELILAAEAE